MLTYKEKECIMEIINMIGIVGEFYFFDHETLILFYKENDITNTFRLGFDSMRQSKVQIVIPVYNFITRKIFLESKEK